MPGTATLSDIVDDEKPGVASLSDIDERAPEAKPDGMLSRLKRWATTPGPLQQNQTAPTEIPGSFEGHPENIAPVGKAVAESVPKVVRGLGRIFGSSSEHSSGLEHGLGLQPGTPEEQAVEKERVLKGATDIMQGGGTLMLPLTAEAAVAKPVLTSVMMAAGYGASKATQKLVHGKVEPYTEEFLTELAQFAPQLAASIAGVHGSIGRSATGEPITATGEAFGGRVAAGAAKTPGTYDVGVKVGPFKAGVSIPRSRPGAPPAQLQEPIPNVSPGDAAFAAAKGNAQSHPDEAAQAMSAIQREGQQAVRVASGLPPVEPPPPVAPPPAPPQVGMGEIAKMGDALAKLPPGLRSQAIIEAHGKLSAILLQQGKVVNPHDGKITIVTKPEQADKLASDFINSEVERRDKLAEEQQKAQTAAAKPTGKSVRKSQSAVEKPVEAADKFEIAAPEKVQSANVSDIAEVKPGAVVQQPNSESAGVRPTASGTESASEAAKAKLSPNAEPTPTRFVKGDRVSLADGSEATIHYSSPAMRLVRLVTEDGRRLTVSGKDVTNLKPVTEKPAQAQPQGEVITPQAQLDAVKKELRAQYPNNSEDKIEQAAREQLKYEQTHAPFMGKERPTSAEPSKPLHELIGKALGAGDAEDLERRVREQPRQEMPRGERRKLPRTAEETQTQELFGKARKELGDDASSDQIMARVEELKKSAPVEEKKFKHRSTQVNIPDDSEAAKALTTARARIPESDLVGKGKETESHVTVRWGLKAADDADLSKLKSYLSSLSPFEATLGKTAKFPPSEASDGAAVIQAPIEAPELHKINEDISKHGEFAERTFDYSPHATVAYVKPDKADRYVGMTVTHGKKFQVNSIAITDRAGKQEEVPLKGSAANFVEPEHPNLQLGEHAAHTEMVRTPTLEKYANENVQMVPTSELDKFKEYDRRETPHPGRDKDAIEKLKADIKANGLKEPLILKYGTSDRKAHLWEGNHRLAAAKELGIKELPVRVITAFKTEDHFGVPVSGLKSKANFAVPTDVKPSEIGIESRALGEKPEAGFSVEKPAAEEHATTNQTSVLKLAEEIKKLRAQAAKVSQEFSLQSLKGYDPHSPLRAEYNRLLKEVGDREDELAKLKGEPTRAEKREAAKAETGKAFANRPEKAMKYGDLAQSQHWQVKEPDYIEKRFQQEIDRYKRAIPEQEAKIRELGQKVGSQRKALEESSLHFWKKILADTEARDPRKAQKFKEEYRKLVKEAVSHGSPVPQEVIGQLPEFQLAQDARERYEKGRHTSFANRSAAINDTMQKEEGFKVKRQDGKPITDAQMKEISTGVDEMVKVLGPELRDMMRGTDLTISHTSGKHPFLSDAGGQYHPVERSISAGINNFLGKPIKALAHETGHWLDFESGRVLNSKALIRPKGGGPSTETHYVSEADRATKPLYELARRTMSDTYRTEKMIKITKLADLPDEQREEVEVMKVVLGPYWREPRELWARMFEQYIATKVGGGGVSMQTPAQYQSKPAYWPKEAWAKIEPLFEEALKTRMDAMRERYAPTTIEGVSAAEPTPPRQPAWKSEPPPLPIESEAQVSTVPKPTETPRREVISTSKAEYAPKPRIKGYDGNSTKLLTSSGERPAKYRVVEAASLIPSHKAQTFARNPEYPEGVQERAYDTSKEAQARVVNQAQKYDPNYTINTNPDAVNGPPIITPDGIVLGGNSRAMSTQRLYHAKEGNRYRSALLAQAQTFGLDKNDINILKQPILVREVEAPKTLDEMRALGSELNKSMTGALGVSERAVSAGKAVSRETLNNIAGMIDSLGDSASLRDAMRERGSEIVKLLVKDGAITDRERPQFVDTSTGGLSEEGKTFVERALLGSVVDDPRLMDSAPKSVLNKLDSSLAALSSLAPRTDAYNILPLIRDALREHAEIASKGIPVEDHLSQSSLFGGTRNPAVDAIVRTLAEKPTAVKTKLRQFAQDANFDVQGQGMLAIGSQPSPSDAFKVAFGVDISDEELENAIIQSAQSEPGAERDGRVESQTKKGAGDLQPAAAGEARRGGEETTTRTKPPTETTLEHLAGESGSFEPGKLAEAAAKATAPLREYLREEVFNNKIARELHSGMYDLESQYSADVLRAVQTQKSTIKQFGGLEHWGEIKQDIYDHLEDPSGVGLDSEQDDFLDDVYLPIAEDTDVKFQRLQELLGKPDAGLIDNYVHRVVKGKGSFFDRILKGVKGTGRGNLLTKSAPQTKGRTMMAIESPDGERRVVSIKGGRATMWHDGEATELGEIKSARGRGQAENETFPEGEPNSIFYDEGKVVEGPDGYDWKIVQATTKEIEANTSLNYYHDPLASVLVANLQVRKALRGAEFIESFKSSPEFNNIAHPVATGTPPNGWRMTQLPQMRDYYFEPHIAEVLDWYADRIKGRDPNIFDKLNSFLRTSIFFNPLIHIPNISIHWLAEKGPSGYVPTTGGRRTYESSVRAINAVTHQNQDFRDMLDVGAPLQSHREETAKLTQLFFDQLTDGLKKEEPWAVKLAKTVGMSPVNLLKAVYRFSGKATWVTNDIAFLQATYEKMDAGMDLKTAIEQTAKHIPDYRLPVRMLNSAGLSKILSNNAITMFMAYHYGALKSYAEMIKSAVGASEPPPGRSKAAESGHGIELLIGVGLITFLLYPLIADKVAQKVTGDKNARWRRAGAATFPYNAYMAATHQKSASDVLQSVVTPAVGTKTAVELGSNRDLYTGRHIYDPLATWQEEAQQVGHKLMESVSPVGQASRISEGGERRKRALFGMVGISFPKTGAEKVASDIASVKPGTAHEDEAKEDAYQERHGILDALRNGDNGPLEKAEDKGDISPAQSKRLRHRATLTPLEDTVNNFSYAETMKVRDAAEKDGSQEEIEQLDRMLARKRKNMWARHEPVPELAE